MLGTDKRPIRKEDFIDDLADIFKVISQADDREEQYLNIAAVACNHRKCGFVPLNKAVVRTSAEEEVKVYCSPVAHQLLNDILPLESYPLLELWLQECNNKSLVVQPEFILMLFDVATKHKPLQAQVLAVAGKRGEWLLPFNEAWKFELIATDENVWQTGTLDQRRNYLK